MHSKRKALFGLFLAFVFVLVQVVAVSAAPLAQTGTTTGTVVSITPGTDSSGNTTYDVVLDVSDGSGGTTQETFTLSEGDAYNLGLLTLNGDGTYSVDSTTIGTSVSIDSSLQTGTSTSGTVESITQSTDSSGNTVFILVMSVPDGSGGTTTETFTLSADEAMSLGLVTQNPDGTYTINTDLIGTTLSLDSTLQTDPCASPEGASQPVGEALASYFCGDGVSSYENLNGYYHDNMHMGYGVIAQACFMAQKLGVTCQSILDAKAAQKFGDGFSFTLADGSVVTNWGQLRKIGYDGVDKSKSNLGAIMSGRADSGNSTTTLNATNDNGPQNSHAGGNGKAKGKDHGHGKP